MCIIYHNTAGTYTRTHGRRRLHTHTHTHVPVIVVVTSVRNAVVIIRHRNHRRRATRSWSSSSSSPPTPPLPSDQQPPPSKTTTTTSSSTTPPAERNGRSESRGALRERRLLWGECVVLGRARSWPSSHPRRARLLGYGRRRRRFSPSRWPSHAGLPKRPSPRPLCESCVFPAPVILVARPRKPVF